MAWGEVQKSDGPHHASREGPVRGFCSKWRGKLLKGFRQHGRRLSLWLASMPALFLFVIITKVMEGRVPILAMEAKA